VSISKRFANKPENIKLVLDTYLSEDRPTTDRVAEVVGTTFHTVIYILKQQLSPERYRDEKKLRYSRAGIIRAGKRYYPAGKDHPNWKGEISDGRGYLTGIVEGRRYFVQRIVFSQMLGIHVSKLPAKLVVHHIDGNPLNNAPENLALTTNVGHRELHAKRLKLHKLPLWGQWLYGISKLKETTPT